MRSPILAGPTSDNKNQKTLKILVAGGSGFIGRKLVLRLSSSQIDASRYSGIDVICMTRNPESVDFFFRGNNVRVVKGDVSHYEDLSNNLTKSIRPDLAVFGSNVYVAWSNWGGAGEMEILLRRSTDGGTTWKVKQNLSQDPGRSSDPEIAAFAGSVYLAWPDGNCLSTHENCDILFRRSTDSGATWNAVKNLSNNAGGSALPKIGT